MVTGFSSGRVVNKASQNQSVNERLAPYKDIEENYGYYSKDLWIKIPLIVVDANGASRTLEFYATGDKNDWKVGSGLFSLEPMMNLDITMVHGDGNSHALAIRSKTNVKNICYPMRIYNEKTNEAVYFLVVIR